jgi:hypothetical protein
VPKIDLPYLGSFQEQRKFLCENPLEEAWAQIARYGTTDFLRCFEPQDKTIDWKKYLEYVEVRIRQAVEFREAARHTTLLTSPLPLYYSFLNLTRAFLVLGPEVMPHHGHGLKFIRAEKLLNSKAQLVRGTFTSYLDASQVPWKEGDEITLGQALGFIVELSEGHNTIGEVPSYVESVIIKAMMGGEVRLLFPYFQGNFAESWQAEFPDLVECCVYESENTLFTKDVQLGKNEINIAQFATNHLLPPLIIQNHAIWHKFRQNNDALKLPRLAYYYIAVFILGSVVRYEPELILIASTPDSQLGWFLKRFLTLAERFFPQLKLMDFYKSQVYFSGSGM